MSRRWTDAEIDKLEEHYPTDDWDTILEALPDRSESSIKHKASRLGVERKASYTHSEKTKRKMSEKRKEAWQDPEYRDNRMSSYEGQDISLTEKQEQLVLGTVLGDGHLHIGKKNVNAQLIIEHKAEDKAYLQWKYEVLKPSNLVSRPPSKVVKINFGKDYTTYRLESRCSPYLTALHDKIYDANKKRAPTEIIRRLEPLGLAVWFQDDGYSYSDPIRTNTYVRLYTDNFSRPEVEDIKDILEEKFSLPFNIFKHKSGFDPNKYGHILDMGNREQINRFMSLIGPHIHPSMSRKKI